LETPPDLTREARYLTSVIERLREAIGGPLVGVYAGGSYALGDYLPGRSDLDVAAVVRPSLGPEAADAVVARPSHGALPAYGPPGGGWLPRTSSRARSRLELDPLSWTRPRWRIFCELPRLGSGAHRRGRNGNR
jgi:hypothetical protein